jgi:homoserine kinase type II
MEHLSAHGVSCPLPVRNRQGEALGRLAGRPAGIVTFLEGYAVHHPDARHCAALGEALAKLHLAGRGFEMSRPNRLSLDGWRALFASHEHEADRIEPGMGALIVTELARLEEAWPRDLPCGVIHADLFPDNVFFLGERVSGLIDFYFACRDALAYDLAISLNAWCFDADWSYDPAKGRALIDAYRRIRPLDARELSTFPILARGAALRFLLTRFVDALSVPEGVLVRPKDPREYLTKLRFHQGVGQAADYGFGL